MENQKIFWRNLETVRATSLQIFEFEKQMRRAQKYVNPSIPKEKQFGEEVFTKWGRTLLRFRGGKEYRRGGTIK